MWKWITKINGYTKITKQTSGKPLIFIGYKAGQFAPWSHSVSRTLNCCGLRHILRAKTYWREWSQYYFPSWSYSILLRLAVVAYSRIFLFRKAVAGQFSLVRCHRDVYLSLLLSLSLPLSLSLSIYNLVPQWQQEAAKHLWLPAVARGFEKSWPGQWPASLVNLLSPDFIIGSLSFKPQTNGIVIAFTLW